MQPIKNKSEMREQRELEKKVDYSMRIIEDVIIAIFMAFTFGVILVLFFLAVFQ